MSVREINYTVTQGTVVPENSQWGGVQYENNATAIIYTLSDEFVRNINDNYGEDINLLYRIDFDSPVAGYQPSGNLEIVEGQVKREVPSAVTASGEPFQSTLTVTVTDLSGEELGTVSSKPSVIYLTCVAREGYTQEILIENISEMQVQINKANEEVKRAADVAERAANNAETDAQKASVDAQIAQDSRIKTEEAKLSLESGAEIVFLGGDAQSEMSVDLVVDSNISSVSTNPVQNKAVDAAIKQAISSAMLAAHPVGSIYMSVNSTSPASIFGGTWEKIRGKFLLAEGDDYIAGSVGGEAAHTLTTTEMPSHHHGAVYSQHGSATKKYAWYNEMGTAMGYNSIPQGGGQPHNNMPPYLAVYVWKRTA